MSEEKVEVLVRGLDAFNRGDRAAWLALAHPEAENFPPKEWPESAPIRGREAIWEFYVEAVRAWENAAFDWGEFVEVAADKVVANQRAVLRGKTSGASVTWSYWVVWTFRGGLISKSEWFASRDEALEAAGITE